MTNETGQPVHTCQKCWGRGLRPTRQPGEGETDYRNRCKAYAEQTAQVAVVDERAEFVSWIRREWPQAPLSLVRDLLPEDHPRYGEYCDESLQRAWVGWQARARLNPIKP